MNIIARAGHCIISPDPPDEWARPGVLAPSRVWDPGASHPRSLQRLPKTGLCLLHSPSGSWDEVDLNAKRVIFDRAGGRLFKIADAEGREYELVCIHERGILAVIYPSLDDFAAFEVQK